MAGYSGTPLPKKLGIKAGSRVLLVNAPDGAKSWLEPLPEGAKLCGSREKNLDVVLFFARQGTEVIKRFGALAKRLQPAGGLWVSWPRKAAGISSDLNENWIRAIGISHGLVDNKVCAVSEEWSGLRFVYRVKDRPARRG
jgi:bifunctional DNA-binding transcriptional regulator/antitoxin component of YhaV-PrlF toxin-antitoxin module